MNNTFITVCFIILNIIYVSKSSAGVDGEDFDQYDSEVIKFFHPKIKKRINAEKTNKRSPVHNKKLLDELSDNVITLLIYIKLECFKKNLKETIEKVELSQKAGEEGELKKQSRLHDEIIDIHHRFCSCFCMAEIFPAFKHFFDDTENLEINEETPCANNSSIKIVSDNYDDSKDPDKGHYFEQTINDNPCIFQRTAYRRQDPTLYICGTGCEGSFRERRDLVKHLKEGSGCIINPELLGDARIKFNENTKNYKQKIDSFRNTPYCRPRSGYTD